MYTILKHLFKILLPEEQVKHSRNPATWSVESKIQSIAVFLSKKEKIIPGNFIN